MRNTGLDVRRRIADLGRERGHRTLSIVGKGNKPALIPLAPRTARAVDLAVGERHSGRIVLDTRGEPLARHSATWVVTKLARRAQIAKHISPHSLRQSFVTACLDAGVPLRDVQVAARHADPRTTMRYDRNRQNLDRHPTYGAQERLDEQEASILGDPRQWRRGAAG